MRKTKPPVPLTAPSIIQGRRNRLLRFRILIDHHFISVLKNNKGSLILKAVKDRLATTGDPTERETLNRYLEATGSKKLQLKMPRNC